VRAVILVWARLVHTQAGAGCQMGGRSSSTGASECTTSFAVLSECSSLQVRGVHSGWQTIHAPLQCVHVCMHAYLRACARSCARNLIAVI